MSQSRDADPSYTGILSALIASLSSTDPQPWLTPLVSAPPTSFFHEDSTSRHHSSSYPTHNRKALRPKKTSRELLRDPHIKPVSVFLFTGHPQPPPPQQFPNPDSEMETKEEGSL